MKIHPVGLCIGVFGAALFFGAGFLTGRLWESEPAGDLSPPAVAERRVRKLPGILGSPPPVDNATQNRRRTEDEGPSEERVIEIERKVALMSTQLESIRNLEGGELIAMVKALNIPNATVSALYPEYLAETARLEEASRGGWGSRHPRIVALNASLDAKYAQMLDASETLKKNLELQLNATRKILDHERELMTKRNSRQRGKSRNDSPAGREHSVKISLEGPANPRKDMRIEGK
jgi:hypothetical protein